MKHWQQITVSDESGDISVGSKEFNLEKMKAEALFIAEIHQKSDWKHPAGRK